jgi:phage terminase large subunit-like protein
MVGWFTTRSTLGLRATYGDAWKVRKAKQSRKIDGLVASVMAHSRAVYAKPKKEVLLTSNPW